MSTRIESTPRTRGGGVSCAALSGVRDTSAASLAGTSTTRSPSASSRCPSGRANPSPPPPSASAAATGGHEPAATGNRRCQSRTCRWPARSPGCPGLFVTDLLCGATPDHHHHLSPLIGSTPRRGRRSRHPHPHPRPIIWYSVTVSAACPATAASSSATRGRQLPRSGQPAAHTTAVPDAASPNQPWSRTGHQHRYAGDQQGA